MRTKGKYQRQLKQHFLKVLEHAADVLRGIKPDGGLYCKPEEQIRTTAPWKFRVDIKHVPDYGMMAFWVRGRIQNRPAFHGLEALLRRHPAIERHLVKTPGPKYGYDCLRESQIVQDALGFFLANNQGFGRNSRLVNRIWNLIEGHFGSPCIETVFTAYLENIRLATRRVKLSESVELVSLTDADVESQFNSNKHFREFYSGRWIEHLSRVRAMVRVTFKEPKRDTVLKNDRQVLDETVAAKYMYYTVNAIRLLAPVQVNSSPIIRQKKLLPFYNHEHVYGHNVFQDYGANCTITSCDYRKLRLIYRNLPQSVEKSPILDSILYRIHLLNLRRVFEDKVVDIFICFEYLLRTCTTEGFSLSTSSDAMALFLARLVGKTKKEKRDVCATVKQGYRIRNRIVHAKRHRKDEHTTICQLENILRSAVRELILRREFRKKPLSEWLL